MKFHHIGIPLVAKKDGMVYNDLLKLWFTDPATSPHNIEFLYFEKECPLAATIQKDTHVAYTVESLEEALKNKSVLVPITEMVPGFKIAFIYDGGLPVELMQIG